jgi:ATP-binding cassette, subfamily B, bacterial MsbA
MTTTTEPAAAPVAAVAQGGNGPWRRFWSGWLRPHLPAMALATVLMAVVAACSSFYPALIGGIVDALAGLSGGRVDGQLFDPATVVWLGPLVVIAVTLVRGATWYASTLVTNRVALEATTALQQDLFGHLLGLDFARLSAEPSGAFSARFLNDVNAIRDAVLKVTGTLIRDVLTLVGVIIAMLLADWQLALVSLAILPLAIGPVSRIGQRVRRTATTVAEQAAGMSGVVEESLGGVRLVKTYGLEQSEAARVGSVLTRRMELLIRMGRQKGSIDPILEVLGGLAIAAVFGFAAWRIGGGGSSVGDLMAFITALLLASNAIRSLGGLNTVMQEGRAGLVRFFAVLDERPSIADAPGAAVLARGPGRIVFRNVGFTYGAAPLLEDVSFEAEPGATVALVGPSGAGKSTVLNLVPRLFEVSAGAITIDGQDVRAVTQASLRARIALVSQDATLFDATVAQNVAMGLAVATPQAIERALELAACDFVARLPQGMDTPVGPRGNRLSGGERQRLSLARAILRDADILLLDEPTSALDAESEARIQEALDSFAARRTTLVVAHRLATVRAADLILVMQAGRIVERGRHDALVAQGGLYAELARLQFQS